MKFLLRVLFIVSCIFISNSNLKAQHTIAREWNETLLELIRLDFARPTVHARNLWHSSAMMYDIWVLYGGQGEPYFIGNEIDGFEIEPIEGFDFTINTDENLDETISYAMYTLLSSRFSNSPSSQATFLTLLNAMSSKGYNPNFNDNDYSSGNPASLGIYIAEQIIAYGYQDGSNEINEYANLYYETVNPPLEIDNPGNPDLELPNNWQQLVLELFVDQSGNVITSVPDFLSPEWGNLDPFALEETDKTVYSKDGDTYNVFLDPGPPPYIDMDDPEGSFEYVRGFEMVLKWSSFLDPTVTELVDVSPASNGNNAPLPTGDYDLLSFYDYENGGDFSPGHDLNPATGEPYEPQMVDFGDYTRVLAEFWADGPDSETPPGHWFSILNYVSDHPDCIKKYEGVGETYSDLEWDVKSYFLLGAAMHDAAITAWSVKGYYDYIRPVSVIRYMAELGQRSDENLPNYSPYGFELVDGFVELVEEGDPLVGANNEHLHKLKAYVWRGPDYISNPFTQEAGVGWILIENWWPYQRPTFVTPPFAGYVSGHSTFSRAAAEILTKFTGDEFFPGGMGEFDVTQNQFLVFEDGPSESFSLQWATYRDASDETSLSRIYGGIHPPADDIPGRIMGREIAEKVYAKAETYFFYDEDGDGYFSYEDCNDQDANINPGTDEICDNLDNDCNGEIDENLTLTIYYVDNDNDGFGIESESIEVCNLFPPEGYASEAGDCNDDDPSIHPNAIEICDNIDNDCNGEIDEELPLFTYYVDSDGDGFGLSNDFIEICEDTPPAGYASTGEDCNDSNSSINPISSEICDDIDNDCNGEIDDNLPLFTYYSDSDGDGFGDESVELILCTSVAPVGFVTNSADCDDNEALIYPAATEISDNGIDEDCNGIDLYEITKIFPNPFENELTIHIDGQGPLTILLINSLGQRIYERTVIGENNVYQLTNIPSVSKGLHYIYLINQDGETVHTEKLIGL